MYLCVANYRTNINGQNLLFMKKIIFFLVCSVLSLSLVAQATLPITDNFDSYADFTINPSGTWSFVDGDASATYGFSGITFPNSGSAMAFIVFNPGTTTPALTGTTAHSGNKMLASFCATTSSNNDWLISPELSGNEAVTITFWASSYVSDYGLERLKVGYSTTTTATSAFTFVQGGNYLQVPVGWTEYSFNFPAGTKYIALNCVSDDAFILFIDDITISAMSTDPFITANPTSINYGTIIAGNSATQTVSVAGFNFTGNITATVSSNDFTVSSDGTNFASTATLPAAGGTLSVKYSPTVAGNATATVTLSATGATPVSINLSGAAIECDPITNYPYSNTLNQEDLCWSVFDDNNDENTFEYYDGYGAVYLYSTTASANDWLISPALVINQPNLEVTFQYYAIGGADYPEKMSVWAITDLSDHTNGMVLIATMNVVNSTPLSIPFTSLSAFNGQTIHIGIKCESDADMYALIVADFEIKEYATSPTLWTENSSLDFGTIANGEEKVQTIAIHGVSLTGPINITSANANFEVSTDGIVYNSTASVPVAGIMTTATLNVKYIPTAVGSHNGDITLSSTDATNITINLSGETVDCGTAKTIPYSEGFEGNIFPAICWKNIDNDGDGQTWFQSVYSPHSGEYCAVSASWTSYNGPLYPDNYLITPPIQLPAEECIVSFWVCGQDPDYAAENYVVKVSTTGTNPSDFTHMILSSTSTAQWVNHQLALSQFAGQTVYIAFIHTNISDMFQIKLDDIEVRAGVGINENTENFNVNIFPNPASMYIHINATSTVERIEIYNVSGQLVHSEEVNNMNATIDILNMTAGMYYAKVYTQTGVNTTKISIVK
jgi:hypothetical protein